jgi:hypothetical protein
MLTEVQKVKLPSHKGFSDNDTRSVKPEAYRVPKKMDKVELIRFPPNLHIL